MPRKRKEREAAYKMVCASRKMSMNAIKWTLKMEKPDRKLLLIGVLLSLINTAGVFVNPLIYSDIIDNVILGGDKSRMPMLIGIIFAVIIVRCALNYTGGCMVEASTQRTVKRLRMYLYDKMQSLDSRFYGRNRTGDLMMKLTGDMDWVRHFICWIIPNTLSNVVLYVGVLIIFLITSPLLTLLAMLMTPLTAYAVFKTRKVMRRVHDRVREETSQLNTLVQENISGNRVVKAFVREDYEIKRFEERNSAYCDAAVNATVTWWRYGPFIEGIASCMSIMLLVFGGIFVIKGWITVGQLTLFLNLAWCLNQPMRLVGTIMNDYQRFMASIDKIMTIYYAKPDIYSPENGFAPERDGKAAEIVLKDVSFSFDSQKILQHIDFEAHPGETVAIMGPTGSGKTTITSLIARFIDPTEGVVMINGRDVREYDLYALRKSVSMAMQDVFLFSDDVSANISYGNVDAPEELIRGCAVDADADGFIKRMPNGYDTIIGERGVGLSGGQRQRISLARALAAESPILILDDTTSAVDMETEAYIQGRLRARKNRATTILIAQRISSVRDADRIYIVEDGRVTEVGTHEELLAKKGYYYSIYCLQQGLTQDARDELEALKGGAE